ncbi:10526_t:CDS:1 [Dentiscutata heterogama]|uniref:10526_t:CDS:1 n=1 Tax=Dentiscutata heterogama TaxID=1316150 RepID=A0ACA9LHS2_9GLOM|nr:10526_t:CDS:1 [Dentiscutata heterogama]
MPNVPKDKHQRVHTQCQICSRTIPEGLQCQGQTPKIHTPKKYLKTNTRRSTMPNREFTLYCRKSTETHYITSKVSRINTLKKLKETLKKVLKIPENSREHIKKKGYFCRNAEETF